MRKALVYSAASAVITVAGLAGCSSSSGNPGTAAGSGTGGTVNMDASWAVEYHSLADLKAHATIAVQGHFSGVLAQTADQHGIPYTDFEFTVDRVLYDPGHLTAASAKLSVHQTGGLVNGKVHQIDDDPLFKVSEGCVLFLDQYQPGHFKVIGGPTGRFEVKNGAVSPGSDEGAKFSGSPDDFAAALRGT